MSWEGYDLTPELEARIERLQRETLALLGQDRSDPAVQLRAEQLRAEMEAASAEAEATRPIDRDSPDVIMQQASIDLDRKVFDGLELLDQAKRTLDEAGISVETLRPIGDIAVRVFRELQDRGTGKG